MFFKLKERRRKIFVEKYIDKMKSLERILEQYKVSESTGVSLSDYVALYETIRLIKPKFVLECGTGKSTWIISQAMLDNCADSQGNDMKLVSMEHNKKWADHAVSILPERFKSFVEICHSPMDTYCYSFVRGTIYKEVPDHPYEFVFVDGPSQGLEGTGTMCNMDFIRVVEKSQTPVSAIIDNRKHTVLAYSLIFGTDKVRLYSNWSGLGVVNKVTCNDMVLRDKQLVKKYLLKSRIQVENGNPF